MCPQDVTGDIESSVFEDNKVTQFGGAIFRGTGSGAISGCDFTGNSAKRSGGAIYDSHETVRPTPLSSPNSTSCSIISCDQPGFLVSSLNGDAVGRSTSPHIGKA